MNMEDITDAYYMDARRVCKDFEIKNVGKYRDLYLKCETLLPAMVLKTSENCVLKFII